MNFAIFEQHRLHRTPVKGFHSIPLYCERWGSKSVCEIIALEFDLNGHASRILEFQKFPKFTTFKWSVTVINDLGIFGIRGNVFVFGGFPYCLCNPVRG